MIGTGQLERHPAPVHPQSGETCVLSQLGILDGENHGQCCKSYKIFYVPYEVDSLLLQAPQPWPEGQVH
jgi:hypothetical protein